MHHRLVGWIWLAAALSLHGCIAPGASDSAVTVPGSAPVKVPVITVDRSKLEPTREAACAHFARMKVKSDAQGAAAAGMLPADYRGFRKTIRRLNVTISFRDSNPACLPHLAAGVQSKGHDILQKTWNPSNLLPEDQQLAGLVSNLMAHPPAGVKVSHPQLTLKNGAPVTCDYDMMDMLEADGSRIPGESPRDLQIRAALNASAAPTPQGHRDRVMHGAQAAYAQYIALHPEEETIVSLFEPEAPLTVFDHDGRVYQLKTVEDDLAFYGCKSTPLVSQWDIEATDDSTTPPRRERLH